MTPMQARPVKIHYCDNCDTNHEGQPEELGPTFKIGCCFEIEWSGTREQAKDLYDYLEECGYLSEDYRECADGCVSTGISDDSGWKCGSCGALYGEDDYKNPKKHAVECCGGTYTEVSETPKITVDQLLRGTSAA